MVSVVAQQSIWIVYCAEDTQYSVHIPYQTGMTALIALQHSGLAERTDLPFPLEMGVFGLKIHNPEQYLLNAGDRLEIYRPLKMNPQDVRRRRAQQHPVGRYHKGNQWKKQHQPKD